MDDILDEIKPVKRSHKIVLGIFVSNVFALITLGLTTYFLEKVKNDVEGVLIFSQFVIIPLVMGIITARFWRDIGLLGRNYTGYSLVNGAFALLMSSVFLGEGFICLIIVSPLFYALIIAVAVIGRAMFRKQNNTLNTSIISVLLIIFIADSVSQHHYENVVSDEMIINALPSEVWEHVVAYERIKEENKYWLFKIGMPSPVETTVDGKFEGAGRKCIFSNGYVFDEKMVIYQPGKNLTFDITHQPLDPEIMGHIDILKGQFLLKDNGNGTTTLTGNSWYRLYVFPAWYYDIWAKSITRNVHLRVMEHIKELSEAK